MIRCLLVFMLALPAMAQLGPHSFTNGRVILVDGASGIDATAIKYRSDKAFKTLTAAKNASQSEDLIWVRPAKYLGTNLAKNGVNYHFEAGAIVTNHHNLSIFNDFNVGVTSIISGAATFIIDWETNEFVTTPHAVLTLSNANSLVSFEYDSIRLRHFAGTDTDLAGFNVNCKRLYVTGNELRDLDLERESFNPDSDPVQSKSVGIIWRGGDVYFNIKATYMEEGRAVVPSGGTTTNSFYFAGNFVKSYTDAFTINGSSELQKWWINVDEIEAGYKALNVETGNKAKFYVSFQKLSGNGGGFGNGAITLGGGQGWINGQKVTALSSPFADFLDITGGINYISVQHWEDGSGVGGLTVGPAFDISGGTNVIEGGMMTVTNVVGIRLSGSHQTLIKDMTIQTVNTGGNGNTNEPVLVMTNGLTLQNVSLISPNASVSSIKATNTANTVAIDGTLQTTTAPGASVIFSKGLLLVGSGVGALNISGTFDATSTAISAPEIDWNAGYVRHKTLTANTTFTFANVALGRRIKVDLTQDGTGGYTTTWPVGIKWKNATNQTDVPSIVTNAGYTTTFYFERLNVAGVDTTFGEVSGADAPALVDIANGSGEINMRARTSDSTSYAMRLFKASGATLVTFRADGITHMPAGMYIDGGSEIGDNSTGSAIRFPVTEGGILLYTATAGTKKHTVLAGEGANRTRAFWTGVATALTESSATTVLNIPVAAGKFYSAKMVVAVNAGDGTDFQATTTELLVGAVNKAGAISITLTPVMTNAVASSGTLTAAFTAVANGASVDVKANAVSSLTQTTLNGQGSVLAGHGDGTSVVTTP